MKDLLCEYCEYNEAIEGEFFCEKCLEMMEKDREGPVYTKYDAFMDDYGEITEIWND